MKEILKSKTMILFTVMVLGIVYMNSNQVQKLESSESVNNETLISANIN